jgi:hypothetical protein
MPDISMCMNSLCPMAKKCYRHEATPEEWQAYGIFNNEGDECEYFMELPKEFEKKEQSKIKKYYGTKRDN